MTTELGYLLTWFIVLLYSVWYMVRVIIGEDGKITIPPTVSQSYYLFNPSRRWVFKIFIFMLAFMMIYCNGAIYSAERGWFGTDRLLYLVSGLLLAGVGVTPTVFAIKIYPWHISFAITGIVIYLLAILVYASGAGYTLLAVSSALFLYMMGKCGHLQNSIFWIEITVFFVILTELGIRLW